MSNAYVANVGELPGARHPVAGGIILFEHPDRPFDEVGINIRILEPGESNAYYHAENQQEDFLVLGGRCTLILDGAEHELGVWDFVHCPAGTRHAFVGSGDGPCWILMIGARRPDEQLEYPVDETAAKHRASVKQATTDPDVAYADRPGEWQEAPAPWPPGR